MKSVWQRGTAIFVVALMLTIGVLSLSVWTQREEMLGNILDFTGHLLVQPEGSPFTDWPQVADRIAKVQGVRFVVPVVEGQVLASTVTSNSGVMIRGIRATDLSKIPLVVDHLQQGTLEGFDESQGVAIGSKLADRLSIRAGDNVTLVAPGSAAIGTAPRIKSYRVTAVFESGDFEFADVFVFMPLTEAQSYFNHAGDITAIEVHIDEIDKIDALRQSIIHAARRPIVLTDWRQRNATVINTM